MLSVVYDFTFGDPLWLRTSLEVFRVGVATLLLTIFLDVVNISTVLKVLKFQGTLYPMAVVMNVFNHITLAGLIFPWLAKMDIVFSGCDIKANLPIIRLDNERAMASFDWWLHPLDSSWCESQVGDTKTMSAEGLLRTLGVLAIQSIGYYSAHAWMHRRENYWMHRFHHRFNKYVVPMAANAVTVPEYVIAYMIPIAVGALIFRPTLGGLVLAANIISLCNLLIHTPALHDLSDKLLPEWIVTTCSHYDHHNVLSAHFAAPTLNVDYFVAKFRGIAYARKGAITSIKMK